MKICLECEGISDTPQDRCASCGGALSDTSAVHFPLRRGEADAANPLLGVVVDGKYLVQGVLGKGGMGTVFRAIHQVSLIPVALKILNPRFSVRGEYREYFLAEAQKAGRVSHEHAGRILDVGESEDGTVYIAMEEVDGVTLHECVHGSDRLPAAIVVDILEQICQGLSAAHQAGLVHRDLSPRNVMVVGRNGRPFVKILDFGIAKGMPLASHGPGDKDVSAPAGFASPPYSAPEHLEGKDVDSRADLYSLGVIAYEALTQQLPVAGSTAKERAEATIRGAIEPLSPPPGTPPQLVKLIRSLLSRDPDGRPASADEVLHVLHAIRQPGSRVLRDVAVLVFVLAVLVCVVAYSQVVVPTLTLRTMTAMKMYPSANEASEKIDYLTSDDLRSLKFGYGGFAAGDLVAQVDGEKTRFEHPLDAVEESGLLALDTGNPTYREFLRKLREECEHGAVSITFAIRGGVALGVARVRVDDDAPVLRFTHIGERQAVINSKSHFRIECDDPDVELTTFKLNYLVATKTEDTDDLIGRRFSEPVSAESLLSAVQPAPSVTPVELDELFLDAVDLTGNRSTEPLRGFGLTDGVQVDFRVPSLRDTTLSVLRVNDGGVSQLRLSAEEPGLTVEIADPEGGWSSVETSPTGETLDIELTARHLSLIDADTSTVRFRLKDPAGNVEERVLRVEFITHEPEVVFEGYPITKLHDLAAAKTLVWSGETVELSFTCNEILKPTEAIVGDGKTVRVDLLDPGLGQAKLRLHGVKDLDAELELTLTLLPETPGRDPVQFRRNLHVQCSRCLLELRDTSTLRYFSQFVGDGLFQNEDEAARQFGEGANWILQRPDARLLRGRILWGVPGSTQRESVDLPSFQQAGATILTGQIRRPGHRVMFLDLRDVLGREVSVEIGNGEASREPGTNAVRVAEFQDQLEPPKVLNSELTLEFLRSTRLVFVSPYDFRAESKDAFTFRYFNRVLKCTDLTPKNGRTEIGFELSWDAIKLAARDATDADLQSEGFEFTIAGTLNTPAGQEVFEDIPGKSIRSSLHRLTLGEKFRALPAVLSDILMIPVLSPLDEFPDPVERELRRRGGFLRRDAISVKDLRDFFLQHREMTRAQYAAIVRGFEARMRGRPQPEQMWFPGDPLGRNRIEEDGMRPTTIGRGQDLEEFAKADPDALIRGIHFYQAYAITRMAGYVIAGDADTFRLPFGVELDLAALGSPPKHLNGVAKIEIGDLEQGDSVATALGVIHGLDFGVREWVSDLPWPVGGSQDQQMTVRRLFEDHDVHIGSATDFAAMQGFTPELRDRLNSRGVVRGVMFDEHTRLHDIVESRAFDPRETDRVLGGGVPGVVCEIQVKRDGEGMRPGRPDAVLERIGLRLAGGRAFVEKVRSK